MAVSRPQARAGREGQLLRRTCGRPAHDPGRKLPEILYQRRRSEMLPSVVLGVHDGARSPDDEAPRRGASPALGGAVRPKAKSMT
jgi:hypothetical protein